jgi:hypothetical protein
METDKTTLKFGFYISLSLVVLTVIAFGLAMMAVPPSGPFCQENCMHYPYPDILPYYPRDYYWMYTAMLQLAAYLMFTISNHFIAPGERKLFTFISVAFSLMSSIVLSIDYFIQFAVVPVSVMNGEQEGIALITQYNDHGLFIAMEELGYLTMAISFFFLAFGFSMKDVLEKAIRVILVMSFLLTAASFLFCTLQFGIDRSYRFEIVAISINWLTIVVIGTLICKLIRRKLASI